MRAKGLVTVLLTMALAFGALEAPAAVKTEAVNCTNAVRQGTRQVSLTGGCVFKTGEPLGPLTGADQSTGATDKAGQCMVDARALTTNPGSIRQSFTIKSGGGAPLATATDRAACEARALKGLRDAGATRESGGNVNTCAVVTQYSTASGTAYCLSTTSYIFSYTANVTGTCTPIPGPNPKPMTCPDNQLGAWAQTGTQAPYPDCRTTWTPSEPRAGDCFTLDRTARLSWTPPTRNSDGSSLTNLAGYDVHFGTTADQQVQTRRITTASTGSYLFTDLAPNPWYFSLTAFTSGGARSTPSNTVLKVVR